MENLGNMSAVLVNNASHERSIWFGGNLITFLITGEETNGAFSLLHNVVRKGTEPPLHTHTREDESVYLLEGDVEYWVGDKHFTAVQGDFIHLPKNLPHRFKLKTATAKALLYLSPAGFENFFKENSVPATEFELPPIGHPPTPQQIAMLMKSSAAYGVNYQQL